MFAIRDRVLLTLATEQRQVPASDAPACASSIAMSIVDSPTPGCLQQPGWISVQVSWSHVGGSLVSTRPTGSYPRDGVGPALQLEAASTERRREIVGGDP